MALLAFRPRCPDTNSLAPSSRYRFTCRTQILNRSTTSRITSSRSISFMFSPSPVFANPLPPLPSGKGDILALQKKGHYCFALTNKDQVLRIRMLL